MKRRLKRGTKRLLWQQQQQLQRCSLRSTRFFQTTTTATRTTTAPLRLRRRRRRLLILRILRLWLRLRGACSSLLQASSTGCFLRAARFFQTTSFTTTATRTTMAPLRRRRRRQRRRQHRLLQLLLILRILPLWMRLRGPGSSALQTMCGGCSSEEATLYVYLCLYHNTCTCTCVMGPTGADTKYY